MDKLDLILFVMGGYALLNLSLMIVMWNNLNSRMDKLDSRMDKLEGQIGKLNDTVNDIDRRLCRIEGAFASRDFCGLRNQDDVKKAE
jgi:hypothetical protein